MCVKEEFRAERLAELQELVSRKGGKCLSENYVNSTVYLQWECKEGHRWKAVPSHIKNGHWCPECAGVKKHTIEEIRKIAEKKGGKCLSKKYSNNKGALLWECAEGHRWRRDAHGILSGAWCGRCAHARIGISQRDTIENMQKLAKQRGGQCLSPKYINSETKLAWQCSKKHVWQATPNGVKSGDWCRKCAYLEAGKYTIEDMRKLARAKEGRCLSERYQHIRAPLAWECKQGHRWKASASAMVEGSWCDKCVKEDYLAELQKLAKRKGGKCVSENYVKSGSPLLWECKEGHRWKAVPGSIRGGHWCPECAGVKKYTIEEIRTIAKQKGGRCLSKVYSNNKNVLEWECAKGHRWRRDAHGILSGAWCPECAGVKKHTIGEMRAFAKQKGGRCLSKVYLNNKALMEWECAEGHRWRRDAHGILSGSWCGRCARAQRGKSQRSTQRTQPVVR